MDDMHYDGEGQHDHAVYIFNEDTAQRVGSDSCQACGGNGAGFKDTSSKSISTRPPRLRTMSIYIVQCLCRYIYIYIYNLRLQ